MMTAMTAPMGMAMFTRSVKSVVMLDELRGLHIALEFDEQGTADAATAAIGAV
jgi:hypothetical protein